VMGAELILKRLPPGENQADQTWRKVAAGIRRSADRMNRLILNLLDVASIEAGRLVIEKKRDRVGSLVRDAIEMQQVLATAKTLALEAKIAAPDDLEVMCDRERLLQVFANLIGNAIKFTPEGGSITVGVEARGPEVRFAVNDTGPGILEDALPHVFDRFWQAQKTARLGTGLGLSIAKGIVEAHGGRIWVESQLGIGTKFFFTLPLGSPDARQVTVDNRVH